MPQRCRTLLDIGIDVHHPRSAAKAAQKRRRRPRVLLTAYAPRSHCDWPGGQSIWKTWPFTHDGGGQGCLPPAFPLPKLGGEPTPPPEPHGPSTMFAAGLPRIPACVPGAPCLLACERFGSGKAGGRQPCPPQLCVKGQVFQMDWPPGKSQYVKRKLVFWGGATGEQEQRWSAHHHHRRTGSSCSRL